MKITQKRIKTIEELSSIKKILNSEAYFRVIEELNSGSSPSILLFNVEIDELPTGL